MTTSSGFITITTLLIVLALLTLIGTSVSLLSIQDSKISQTQKEGTVALGFVESCAEEALLRLNEENTVPATITLSQGTCSVVSEQTGNDWDLTVEGTVNGFTRTIHILVTRGTTLVITEWRELP